MRCPKCGYEEKMSNPAVDCFKGILEEFIEKLGDIDCRGVSCIKDECPFSKNIFRSHGCDTVNLKNKIKEMLGDEMS